MNGPPAEPDQPVEAPPPLDPERPARPGLTTFTIEGRAAPGLFVVGWLATLLGAGAVAVGVLGGGSLGAGLLFALGLALVTIGLLAAAGGQAIERRASGGHRWAGPSPVLVFACGFALAQLLAVGVSVVLRPLGVDLPRPAEDLLRVAIPSASVLAVVSLVVVGTGALSWTSMGLNRDARQALADLAWGAVIAGPVILATMVVASVLVSLLRVTPESPLPPTGELGGLLVHLMAGAVIAPVSEEVLFRGVATTAWVRRFGVWPGILRGALFFAVAHVLLLGGSTLSEAVAVALVGFAGRLPVAIALGWVYVRRRSLWASIGLHSAFNAVLLLVAHVATRSGAGPA